MRALARYLREVDAVQEDAREELFTRSFGHSRAAVLESLATELQTGAVEANAPAALIERLQQAFLSERSRWCTDVFDLVYLRTALSKHHPRGPELDAMLLYLDYRVYRAQRSAGIRNEPLARQLLRRSTAVAVSSLGSSVRYYLLTDHALDLFGGRMAALPQLASDLTASIRACVESLRAVNSEDAVAALALGHFHLFYPSELGADRAIGLRMLDVVLARDPACEEAYLHIAAFGARQADRSRVGLTLRAYRRHARSALGPNLLAQMLEHNGESHESDSSEGHRRHRDG